MNFDINTKGQTQNQQPGRETKMEPEPVVIRDSYRGSGKLDDKVALITGGDSGIGRAVAVHFAREGANVAIVYLEETQDAKDTQAMVEAEGKKCLLLKGDIRKEKFCQQAVEKTVKQLGQLNILVNNAAEQHPKDDIREISAEQLETTFVTNVFHMFHFVKAALNISMRVMLSSIPPPSPLTGAARVCSIILPPRVPLWLLRALCRAIWPKKESA